ncbi:MAG: hypothetical protein L7T60_04735 [Flavobacteriaceae bacterium]|jgi:hypothetical protein|nr:hypothetical protein [Flavobacteriaceae bacterium]|tara:strand:- start:610 stop:1047 length:438 start_codon:yes stop_codon:yes gene_type:complete
MKPNFFILIFVFSFYLTAFSQEKKTNSWITEYPKNIALPLTNLEIKKIEAAFEDELYLNRIYSSKSLITDIKDILRNRVSIELENIKDISHLPLLSSLNFKVKTKFDLRNFNPLLYDFDFQSKTQKMFRVDDTNYIIIVKPKSLK